MDDPAAVISKLEAELARHPAGRAPIEHATALFHLGTVLTGQGRLKEAEDALRRAVELFGARARRVERAKALVALGAALRQQGRPGEGVLHFEEAAKTFGAAEMGAEQAAALFNLGLVSADTGRDESALEAFLSAQRLFDAVASPAEAGAARREVGAVLLRLGEPDRALPVLGEAVDLAERAGDYAGAGGGANILGLAQLALGRASEAVGSFQRASGEFPESRQPQEFAMAKANLALAYERSGDHERARLAAQRARCATQVSPAVGAQVEAVLARLGSPAGDLVVVLDTEPAARWPAVVRDETTRWVRISERDRTRELSAWIEGQAARPDRGVELAEALLGALFELPPREMLKLARTLLRALHDADQQRSALVRSQISRAMARFGVPQWMRLRDAFNSIERELGGETTWT